MGNTLNRLIHFMREEGINDNQLTIAAGIANGSIGKAKNGKSKGIGSENLEKILEAYPQLNGDWLLTGKGEMLKKTEDIIGDGSSNVNSEVHIDTSAALTKALDEMAAQREAYQSSLAASQATIDRLLSLLEKQQNSHQ